VNWNNGPMEYRRAAVGSASAVSLVVMLYDTLLGDMRRAIAALQESNVEKRTFELKHALLVVQQLEGSLDQGEGGMLVQSLTQYYGVLRDAIIRTQASASPELLNKHMALLLDLRQTWTEWEAAHPAAV
jgi:flagellar secretion chaperone FliS